MALVLGIIHLTFQAPTSHLHIDFLPDLTQLSSFSPQRSSRFAPLIPTSA
jgi:hypothetical protein